MKLFGKELTFNGFPIIHKGDLKIWEGIGSDYDDNGIATVISYKRGDGRLFLKITLTNKVDGAYQNYVVTNYSEDGVTVKSESDYSVPIY